MAKKRQVYRDPLDLGWAIAINILITGLMAEFLPDIRLLPVDSYGDTL